MNKIVSYIKKGIRFYFEAYSKMYSNSTGTIPMGI